MASPPSPRWRALVAAMEETATRTAVAEEEARARATRGEKQRLGLSEEEEILFMAERTRLTHWPIAVLSLALLVSSALISERGGVSFVCLVLGLGGLAFLSFVRGRMKLYLTNFRVLLWRRPFAGRKPRWSQVHYPEVRKLTVDKGLGSGSLMLTAEGKALKVQGLGRADLERAAGIVRSSMSTGPPGEQP